MAAWWLLIGSPGNWRTSFENGNLWGLKEIQRGLWEHMQKGDNVLMYASSPVRGVIGLGIVQTKFVQDRPLWDKEVEQGKVLWPLVIEINVRYCLPQDVWRERAFSNEMLSTCVQGRQPVQMVESEFASQLLQTFPPDVRPTVTEHRETLKVAEEPEGDAHEETIQRLLEIGRLQKFIAEKEYDMDGNRLDVVWRRVPRSVPTYVFEVQVGGNIHSALAKLKHAHDIWNSNIYLVSTRDQKPLADKLLSGMFHEIQGQARFIETAQIRELLQSKKRFYQLEAELGIL